MNNENNNENKGRKRFHLDAETKDGYEWKSHSPCTTGCCRSWNVDGKNVFKICQRKFNNKKEISLNGSPNPK